MAILEYVANVTDRCNLERGLLIRRWSGNVKLLSSAIGMGKDVLP